MECKNIKIELVSDNFEDFDVDDFIEFIKKNAKKYFKENIKDANVAVDVIDENSVIKENPSQPPIYINPILPVPGTPIYIDKPCPGYDPYDPYRGINCTVSNKVSD